MKTTRNIRARRHPSPIAGFSLIEVMIAMVIFAIGVLSLGVCVPAATKRIGKAGNQTHASTLAAQRAETLLMTPYSDGALTAGTHADAKNPVDGYYYVQWTVTDDQPINACKRIVVNVSRWSTTNPIEAAVTVVCPQSGG